MSRAAVGMSKQYLSEIERGTKEPSSEMLRSVCGALGLPLETPAGPGRAATGSARDEPEPGDRSRPAGARCSPPSAVRHAASLETMIWSARP